MQTTNTPPLRMPGTRGHPAASALGQQRLPACGFSNFVVPLTAARRSRCLPVGLNLACGSLAIAMGFGQSQMKIATPKFEVASVKPCRTDLAPDARSGAGNSSPETLDINCQTVRGLIQM